MTFEDKAKVYDVLFEDGEGSCFDFRVNMNDTFGYACAQSEVVSGWDMDFMGPVIAAYGHDALVAYAAVKLNVEPIDCACNHKNENYYAAKTAIAAKKALDEYFMEEV